MKKRVAILAIIAVLVIIVLWRRQHQQSIPTSVAPTLPAKSEATQETSSPISEKDVRGSPWTGSDAYKRKLIAAVRETIAEANAPVAFYGVVLDQHDQPVPGVAVKLGLRTTKEPAPGASQDVFIYPELKTDAQGRFSLTGEHGSLLKVDSLMRDGYEAAPSTKSRSYWYWSAIKAERYESNADRPEVYRMWKMTGPEKLVVKGRYFDFPYDGTVVTIDLLTGERVKSGGDFRISMERTPRQITWGQTHFAWKAIIEAVDGGLILTPEEMPYAAPESGYQPQLGIDVPANAEKWTSEKSAAFYLKSRGGKYYSRVSVRINAASDRETTPIGFSSYLNPTGSRNLEYSQFQDYTDEQLARLKQVQEAEAKAMSAQQMPKP